MEDLYLSAIVTETSHSTSLILLQIQRILVELFSYIILMASYCLMRTVLARTQLMIQVLFIYNNHKMEYI